MGRHAGVSRRDFMKGAALGTIGAGISSMGLVGCAPAKTSQSSKKDANGSTAPDDQTTIRQSAAKLNPQDSDSKSTGKNLDMLFSEWKFGGMTLANRIVKSAAGSDTQSNVDEMVAYYTNFAKGGVVMEWIEDCADMFDHFPLNRKQARGTIPFKQIADAVHAEGGHVGYQLSCMGYTFSGTKALSGFDSAVAADLTLDELHTLQEDYISAARYLKDRGIDAIEVNAAGNNLPQAFFSRMRNARTDQYGPQSFQNRTRFVCEIIQGIKKACGADYPVQVLINGIEENDKNIGQNSLYTTVEENKEIVKELESAGANGIHVRIGPSGMHVAEFAADLYFTGYGIEGTTSYGTQFDFSRHWEGKLSADHSGCGLMIDVAGEIKSAVSIPVGCVTYMDPAHAPDLIEQALEDGKIDFLLMNRPLTVDTEYVNKLKEQRFDEIAPCTRCLHCHYDFDKQGKVYEHCRVNACTQRAYRAEMPEGYEPPAVQGKKNIMVIGGGPAGMEAARVAAQRGYTVTLYEKKSSLGGLLPFAHAVKGPHENLDILCDYLKKQQELCGVKVVTGHEVDADFVRSEKPDAVVIATGGKTQNSNLVSNDGTNVIAIDDFMNSPIGSNVCVIGANERAFDTAQYLVAQGKQVNMVFDEPVANLDKGQSAWVKTFSTPMLYARGSRIWPNAKVAKIGNGTITVSGELGTDIDFACDTVIEALDYLPDTELSNALSGMKVYSIGDCSDPWNIAEAIKSGNLVARKL